MNKTNDIVGTRIGVMDILYECDFRNKDGHKMYHVRCSECGWEADEKKSDIKRMTKCTHIGVCGSYINFKNSWTNERLKRIFDKMKQRCYKKSDKDYRWYGAKGITVCDEWLNNTKLFEEWAFNNGYENHLTIDRLDENKNYCPDNCVWVTKEDNSKYKSTTSLIDVDGIIHTGRDWAKTLGLGVNMINRYINTYGKENTIEFIRRYMNNPTLKLQHGKSYYELYMEE